MRKEITMGKVARIVATSAICTGVLLSAVGCTQQTGNVTVSDNVAEATKHTTSGNANDVPINIDVEKALAADDIVEVVYGDDYFNLSQGNPEYMVDNASIGVGDGQCLQAVDNGDGTATFTLSRAQADATLAQDDESIKTIADGFASKHDDGSKIDVSDDYHTIAITMSKDTEGDGEYWASLRFVALACAQHQLISHPGDPSVDINITGIDLDTGGELALNHIQSDK